MRIWGLTSALVLCVSCSSSSSDEPAPPADDGGVGNDSGGGNDAGADTSPPFVPAKFPPFPQFLYRGGPVIKSPKFKTITFQADPNAATIEDFVAKLAASSFWLDSVSEYSVGAATNTAPVRLGGTPAALYAANTLQNYLEGEFGKTGGGTVGPPDPSTVYALFLPAGTSYTMPASAGGGQTCPMPNAGGIFGFHSYYARADMTRITFAIVGNCGTGHANLKGIDQMSSTGSHEFFEAVTDPYSDKPGWNGIDPDHAIWDVLLGENNTRNEIGDPCDFSPSFFIKPPDAASYYYQRMWSNKAAKNGVVCGAPETANVVTRKSVPVLPDKVSFKHGAQTYTSLGVKLAIGESKTIDIILSSEAPTDPWTVAANQTFNKDVGPQPSSDTLQITLDKTTGKNGDVIKATIKLLAVDPTYAAAPFLVKGIDASGQNIGVYLGIVSPN